MREARLRSGIGRGIWVRGRREGAVGILVGPSPCGLDVVRPFGSSEDLQDPLAVAHGIAVCDGALRVPAQDIADLVASGEGNEGAIPDLGRISKRRLRSGRQVSAMNQLAASTVAVSARLYSDEYTVADIANWLR